MPSGNDANIIKEVDVTKDGEPVEVSRYLRLRFTSGNTQAASRGIGVYEFEVYGDLSEMRLPEILRKENVPRHPEWKPEWSPAHRI